MKHIAEWKPGKFIFKNGRLIASRDKKEVSTASRLISDILARKYQTSLKTHAKGTLLDLGCGKVPLYLAYRDFVSENICVDWSNSLHLNNHLDFECDLTKVLPLPDEHFDTILLSDVLEHIPDPALLWQEMTRILAVNGKIIMNVPFFYWLHEQPHDYYRYTKFALQRFVNMSGLHLVELTSVGGAPEIMADITAKNISRVPGLGAPMATTVQWLVAQFLRTSFGRRLSNATKEDFPLGYFLVAEKRTTPSQ